MKYILENNIIKTPNVNVDDGLGGVGTVLFEYMKKFSTRISQVQSETNESDTYESLLKKCISTAEYLKSNGIQKGDLVCVCSDMTLDSCVPLISAYFIGAVTYCLEPTLPVSESAELVKLLPPKIVFISENVEATIKDVLKQANVSVKYVVLESMMNKYCPSDKLDIESYKPEHNENLSDTICIYFSSGSTGVPKAILLNHYYFLSSIQVTTNTWSRNGINLSGIENHVILSYSNWHWVTSINTLILSITCGANRILCRNFDGNTSWSILKKYKVTNLYMSPYHCVEFYVNRPENPQLYLSSLKEILTGGSKLSEDYIIQLNKILNPSAVMRATYGMTEVGFLTNFDPTNQVHRKYIVDCPNSVGCPVNGVSYKILDLSNGECLGPNQPGELRIKLSNPKLYLNGYYKLNTSNLTLEECFDEDGWFKTEDVAYYDENFCFYIVDRLKARIIYKDWLVYPSVIEKVLLEHPRVKNAVVIGVPHSEDGETLMGVVILNNDVNPKENNLNLAKELEQFVEKHVDDYQRLRSGVKIVNEFPLTASRKINRLKIKELVLQN